MRLEKLRKNVDAGFLVLDQYQEGMEKLLRKGQERVQNRIDEIHGAGLTLEEINPVVLHEYPRYLRYSYIALLVAFFEKRLRQICVEVGKKKGLTESQVRDEIRGEGMVRKAKRFLKKHLQGQFAPEPKKAFLEGWEKDWEQVQFLVLLRNCVLHTAGEVEEMRKGQKTELLKAQSTWKNQGYRIEDGYVVLEQEFCQFARKVVNRRLVSLLTLV